MAGEPLGLQLLARRVKKLALDKAEHILANPTEYSLQIYNETYLTVLKNAVPRTQEITGEGGEAIKLIFDKTFNVSNSSSEATGDNKEQGQV
jgi:hypothetical protein